MSRAAGDYGTRFIAAAGVVNLLAVFDAIEIATGTEELSDLRRTDRCGAAAQPFWAMLLFALLVSVALACLTKRAESGAVKYALWSFALFVLIGVGVAWLMYPLSR